MKATTNNIVCTVCQKHKNELRPRKSKLMVGMQMFLCNECFAGKREPRFAIILVGRSEGLAAVEEQLRLHRYVGEEILAVDLV